MTPQTRQAAGAGFRDGSGTWRWPVAGAVAGLMMIACMLLLAILTGVPSLPELFEDQVIAVLPGSLFGFVLDRLQFAAKPLLFVSLASVPVPGGAALGWLYGHAWPPRHWLGRQRLVGGSAYGVVVWLVLQLAVVAWGAGVAAPISSAGLLLASTEVYGIALVALVGLFESPADAGRNDRRLVDRGRRAMVFGGLSGGALVLAGGAIARMLTYNTEQPTAAPAEAGQAEMGSAPATNLEPTPMAEAAMGPSNPSTSITIPQGVAEEITPNDRFYVISKNFNDPRVNAYTWSLQVSGLVEQPRQFSYAEILALPSVSQYTTLECISNTLGGKLMSNAYWTGFPLGQVLGNVGLQPTAHAVIFRSADNYYESFPLGLVLAPGVLLAHTMNGAPLPDKHGFPLRLILPGRYGMKNPKWITRIELVAEPIEGYWVRRGWDREALVQTVARIDTPADNSSAAGLLLQVGGVAFAGSRGINQVEASLDGGTTWRVARATAPLGSTTWVRWAVDWEDVSPGTHVVLARATDGTGALQVPEENGSFPKGATGYHRARIEVSPSA